MQPVVAVSSPKDVTSPKEENTKELTQSVENMSVAQSGVFGAKKTISGFPGIYVPSTAGRTGKRMHIQKKSYKELLALQEMTNQLSSELLLANS